MKSLSDCTVMVSCAVFILFPFWMQVLVQACKEDELSREVVLSWFREQVLVGLGLIEPPLSLGQEPDGKTAQPQIRERYNRVRRASKAGWVNQKTSLDQENAQITLFSSSDSACAIVDSDSPKETTNNLFTYHFKPSIKYRDSVVTSAQFWFYAGEGATENSSASLFFLSSAQQLLQAVETPSKLSSDGWTTYHLDQFLLESVARGPFLLQVHCSACQCHTSEPDKTPFLHLHVQPRRPTRSPRQAEFNIPWSPSAIYLLQRPSQERPQHSDCHRAEIEINFEELGWDNWIIHPKTLTFYYCHGNCSAGDRAAAMLGMSQCCAPVPGTMKSLKITTTSDGGYSFKYETLPNIMPEECTCI